MRRVCVYVSVLVKSIGNGWLFSYAYIRRVSKPNAHENTTSQSSPSCEITSRACLSDLGVVYRIHITGFVAKTAIPQPCGFASFALSIQSAGNAGTADRLKKNHTHFLDGNLLAGNEVSEVLCLLHSAFAFVDGSVNVALHAGEDALCEFRDRDVALLRERQWQAVPFSCVVCVAYLNAQRRRSNGTCQDAH